jgi:hypothetical protein
MYIESMLSSDDTLNHDNFINEGDDASSVDFQQFDTVRADDFEGISNRASEFAPPPVVNDNEYDLLAAPGGGEISSHDWSIVIVGNQNLTDAEYLEQSVQFGQQWFDFVHGSVATSEVPTPLPELEAILGERSSRFAQIPQDEQAQHLIERRQLFVKQQAERNGDPTPHFPPLTSELLAEAEAHAIELRPGVPAVLTNARRNQELFNYMRPDFAAPDVEVDVPDAIPFVILNAAHNGAGKALTPTAVHEATHVLWHTVTQKHLASDVTTEREALHDSAQWAFVHIQDEGVSISTAGEDQFTHRGNIRNMDGAHINGLETIKARYEKLGELYSAIYAKVDPRTLTLGIMQARNMDELRGHFQRMATIVKDMPDRERPNVGDYL